MRTLWIVITLMALAPLTADSGFNPATLELPKISDVSTDMAEEMGQLDALIAITEKNLQAEKEIREQMREYERLQQLYLRHAGDRQLLFRMIKNAFEIRELMRNHHLTHLFSKSFVEELNLFAQIAEKRPSPRPS